MGVSHNHDTSLELLNWYLKSSNFCPIFTGRLLTEARDFLEDSM